MEKGTRHRAWSPAHGFLGRKSRPEHWVYQNLINLDTQPETRERSDEIDEIILNCCENEIEEE